MKQLWLLATALGFAGFLTAQDAAPKGPVVAATDDRVVAASDEDEGNEGRFYVGPGIGAMRTNAIPSPVSTSRQSSDVAATVNGVS